MPAVDKAALLASRGIGTRMVDVPGVGEVEVRGLTRAEALYFQQAGAADQVEMECRLLSVAMVNPALTKDEVAEWQKVASAGELEPISQAIQELSGLKVTALKEEMQQFRD